MGKNIWEDLKNSKTFTTRKICLPFVEPTAGETPKSLDFVMRKIERKYKVKYENVSWKKRDPMQFSKTFWSKVEREVMKKYRKLKENEPSRNYQKKRLKYDCNGSKITENQRKKLRFAQKVIQLHTQNNWKEEHFLRDAEFGPKKSKQVDRVLFEHALFASKGKLRVPCNPKITFKK